MNATDIEITDHAYKRMKERNGWNKKAASRMAERAFERGKDLKGTDNHLVRLWAMNRTKDNDGIYKLYGKDVFIFHSRVLVTVFPCPDADELLQGNRRAA